jgi:hypothetical protein
MHIYTPKTKNANKWLLLGDMMKSDVAVIRQGTGTFDGPVWCQRHNGAA